MISQLPLEIINSLNILELEALKYFESNKEEVINSSIQSISKKVFLSTATIMRLCKKLGFSGFSELKYVLKQEIQADEQISLNLNYNSLLKYHVATINNTVALLRESDANLATDILLNAKTIHLFGKGITYCCASYISKILQTLGINNFCYESTTIAYIAMEQLTSDDCVILFSLSGNTHQVVRAGKIAKLRNAKVISITAHTANELTKISDCSLSTFSDPSMIRSGLIDIESRIPMLFVANLLVNLYFEKKFTQKKQ